MTESKKIAKLTVNNQIVSMRRDVKRARLWLINNLSQRIKRLNERKGTELQKEKAKRKTERLRSEIEVLKHIDIDDVSKYALCTKFDLNNVATELEKLEPEQRAMFRLAVHKLVQIKVSEFREKHPIPLDYLILTVRALGSRYQKKKQKNKLKTKIKEPSSKKAIKDKKIGKKLSIITEEDKTSFEGKHEECNDDLSTDIVNFKNDGNNMGTENSETKEQENVDNDNYSDQTNEVEEGDINNKLSPKKLAEQKILPETKLENSKKLHKRPEKTEKSRLQIEWPKLNQNRIDKTVGTMEIRRINLDNLNEDSILTNSNLILEEESVPTQPPPDSFFLGGEDPPSENEDEQENVRLERGTFSRNRKDIQYNQRCKDYPKEKKKSWAKAEFNTRKEYSNPSLKKTKHSSKDPEKEVKGSKEEVLHPSWEAKRKLKDQAISLTSFQGKKIKFDDD